MRRVISIHLILVVVAVIGYCYAVVDWSSVKPVGPNGFPGSPDWSYLYFSAYERYLWMSGMLFGLTVAGVPLLLLERIVSGRGRMNAAVLAVAIVTPALALALGHAHESRTVLDEGGAASAQAGRVGRLGSTAVRS